MCVCVCVCACVCVRVCVCAYVLDQHTVVREQCVFSYSRNLTILSDLDHPYYAVPYVSPCDILPSVLFMLFKYSVYSNSQF